MTFGIDPASTLIFAVSVAVASRKLVNSTSTTSVCPAYWSRSAIVATVLSSINRTATPCAVATPQEIAFQGRPPSPVDCRRLTSAVPHFDTASGASMTTRGRIGSAGAWTNTAAPTGAAAQQASPGHALSTPAASVALLPTATVVSGPGTTRISSSLSK